LSPQERRDVEADLVPGGLAHGDARRLVAGILRRRIGPHRRWFGRHGGRMVLASAEGTGDGAE
jgi:hypothetical protein